MSAFVVEDKTINRILTWLGNSDNRWDLHQVLAAAEICHQTNSFLPCPDDWEEQLGTSMFILNCDAVNARYGKDQAQEFRPLNYSYQFELPVTDAQVLKSLQCWLYQCSEGDVPERPLYKAFREVERSIAVDIVRRLDVYENASWG
jgi:hypothetical protein